MAHPIEGIAPGPPVAQPAAGVIPVPPGPPAPVHPPIATRTYRDYYGDRGHSPAPDCIVGFLAGYRFTDIGGAGVPTPAHLRDQTVTLSDRQPMAFLCLITGLDGAPEVMVMHRVVRFMDLPGDDPTG